MTKKILPIALLLCGMAVAAVNWTVPAGWKSETIPFPLDFAPQLAYHGTEELRFAPGFKDPRARDYFTYAFIWALDPAVKPDAAEFQKDLQSYFAGLMNAVAKEKKGPQNVVATTAHVTAQGASWNGTVDTWDAFYTGKPLHLEVRISEPRAGVIYFEVSPHLKAVRQELDSVRQGYHPSP